MTLGPYFVLNISITKFQITNGNNVTKSNSWILLLFLLSLYWNVEGPPNKYIRIENTKYGIDDQFLHLDITKWSHHSHSFTYTHTSLLREIEYVRHRNDVWNGGAESYSTNPSVPDVNLKNNGPNWTKQKTKSLHWVSKELIRFFSYA